MKQTNKRGEEGLVAIVVATILMIILSLVTLGFARLMQGEQKQALDRSLSSQAFYAAESAVNDAVRRIQNTDPLLAYTQDKTTCAADSTFSGVVDSSLAAQYSCLLIDQAPDTLEYTQGSIGTNFSKVIPVRSDTNALLGQIRVAWEEDSGSASAATTSFSACPSTPIPLPPFSGGAPWSSRTGILRLDLIPADTLNRDTLIDRTASLYLYPCTGAGSVSSINFSDHVGQTQKGQIIPVRCTANAQPRDCEISIVMNNASAESAPNVQYYLRAKSVYRASDMTVRAFDTAPIPNQMALRGAQVQIDATGKVSDVIRRIQVRVPVNKAYPVPEFAIQTTDSICKQIQVAPAPANIVTGVGPGQTCPY